MNIRPKAIILDMDGTMFNHKNEVSDTLTDYIKELRNRGELIFIATGRTMEEITEHAPADLEVDGIVSANGMVIYMGNQQLAAYSLEEGLVETLVEKAGENGIYYEVHPGEGQRMALKKDQQYFTEMISTPYPETMKEDEWLEREAAMEDGSIAWKETIQTDNIAKIYFFSKDMTSMLKWRELLESEKEKTDFSAFSSSDHNVEVMGKNISKATGIQYLLDRFKLKSVDVMMVGDSENDLPLMEIAGHSVAMKNAPDRVKAKVDEVTEFDYKEDGLYRFLINKYDK